jgi:hypothetical protein
MTTAPEVVVEGVIDVIEGASNCSVTPKGLLMAVRSPSVAVRVYPPLPILVPWILQLVKVNTPRFSLP